MDSRLIGGMMIIVGTSVGGGMLALPIAAASGGFYGAVFFLSFCWALMTFAALLLLEVNLALKPGSHIISMARETLGRGGEVVAWVTYLLLLYCLIAAYISSGSDVLESLLLFFHISVPRMAAALLFTLIFGYVVYLGIQSIDYVNRGFISVKFAALFVLILLILPRTNVDLLGTGNPLLSIGSITVMLTSFGSATVIPSLRVYFDSDVRKLRFAVLAGSMVPLVCYIAWVGVIFGVVPREGEQGLIAILDSSHSTTDLVRAISSSVNSIWVTDFAKVFTSISVVTSFLGVSLSLADFLTEGLNSKHQGDRMSGLVMAATYAPPLFFVLFYPAAFIKGLSVAGIFCIILLMLLPALMAWSLRYYSLKSSPYRVVGGKFSLLVTIILSIVIIGVAIEADRTSHSHGKVMQILHNVMR